MKDAYHSSHVQGKNTTWPSQLWTDKPHPIVSIIMKRLTGMQHMAYLWNHKKGNTGQHGLLNCMYETYLLETQAHEAGLKF